jgi:excinuclease ABC subunit A
MEQKVIRVVGANAHNLKNLSVDIPRDKFVVITGLSGSGKSSLAFDTIFAEGQRRYVESLSAYARQFLGQMTKPDVEYIEGLSPAVSIDQKATSRNPRSTVGTVTEVYDYLRLLFAKVGVPHCPKCGKEVVRQSAQEIVAAIMRLPEQSKLMILSPIVRHRKGTHTGIMDEITKAGFVRARVDGDIFNTDETVELDRYKNHTIEAVVDRIVLNTSADHEEQDALYGRLTDSVETALQFGDGLLTVHNLSAEPPMDVSFSEHLACPDHDISFPEIEPRTFSFNTPHGACPDCQGIGTKLEIDPDLLIPDKSLSIEGGVIKASEWGGEREIGGYYWQMLVGACEANNIDMTAPYNTLGEKAIHTILYGSDGKEVVVRYKRKSGKVSTFSAKYEGCVPNLERRFRETSSNYMRDRIMQFMNNRACPTCNGARLRPEALSVTLLGHNILDVTDWPVIDTLKWSKKLSEDGSPLSERDMIISQRILKELEDRLRFMVDVGLDYLTLSRSAVTLSGGEAQRIRLATQIGSRLMGVLYVLDEPSIGLHARDNERLLKTLVGLRDLGNTVLVVEHDDETIRSADWILDLGPGAGEYGGEVVASGPLETILEHPESLTAAYLSGRKAIPMPSNRRKGNGKILKISGAVQNNLKNIDVEIPLGSLICVTGVSGSGKSSLINEILYKSLARELNRARTKPGKYSSIEGMEHLDKIININQSPIGRTPRSNPATYTKLFDIIRQLFAGLPESKIRGYKIGRFSFNVKGGRCESCKGQGQNRIEMQFLPDVYVPCEICGGTRYNRETLQVKFKGKNIADVLGMSITEALGFFSAHPKMLSKLQTLVDVGLGYIRIGQSAITLSGGEAQRIKLAKELSKRSTGKTIYVLDEPSVGLHAADVHKLVEVIQKLAEGGNTIIIIEHNMDIIKVADHIIDLGPEGGDRGGEIVAQGTPEEVAKVAGSYTGKYLAPHLKKAAGVKQ